MGAGMIIYGFKHTNRTFDCHYLFEMYNTTSHNYDRLAWIGKAAGNINVHD